MTARTTLPAGLAPWADGLAALTPGLALALGPLVRHLDALVGEREPLTSGEGALDGYGGLTRTGRPELLLPSEWLLAEELPDEFLRRLVNGELLHLAPEYRKPSARGKVVALVDAGPSQAGPGRLVQLAALIVLHRRAAQRGSELVVDVLGSEPAVRLTGDLPELLRHWLAERRESEPEAGRVAVAEAALDAEDEAWLLTSPELAAALPARRRTLASGACAWDAGGATAVRIALGGGSTELPLPEREIAVRALRGAEFRRGGPSVVELPPTVGLRLPAFNSLTRTLLVRTGSPKTIAAVRVPDRPDLPGVRARRYELPGRVVAAARIGRRVIALVAEGGELATHVIGRPLGTLPRKSVSLAQVGLDREQVDQLVEQPLLPVTVEGSAVLSPLAGSWRRIFPDGSVEEAGPAAGDPVRPGFSWARDARGYGGKLPARLEREAELVFGLDALAWSVDGEHWQVERRSGARTKILVPPRSTVIGLVGDGGQVALITLGNAGLLVSSVRSDGTRTLSKLSGGSTPPVVHPGLPLIAAQPRPGRILVADAFSGRILQTLGSDA